MNAVHVARINMCGFYRLDLQPDLFGGFAVVKGRIGGRGRMGFRAVLCSRVPAVGPKRKEPRHGPELFSCSGAKTATYSFSHEELPSRRNS
jgi:hypothetical protein